MLIVIKGMPRCLGICSLSSSERKDPLWNHIHLVNAKDPDTTICNYHSKVTKGSVYRTKRHSIGGYGNEVGCKKVPKPVKKDTREYMLKKQVNLLPTMDHIMDLDEEAEDVEIGFIGRKSDRGFSTNNWHKKGHWMYSTPMIQ